MSSKIVLENPFLGLGYGNFEGMYAKYQSDYFATGIGTDDEIRRAGVVRYAYNIFLQILCEQGLVGLALSASVLALVIKRASSFVFHRNGYYRFISTCGLSCLTGIAVCGQFSYPLDILPVQILLVISLACMESLNAASSASVKGRSYTHVLRFAPRLGLMPGILLLFSALLLSRFATKRIGAYKRWKTVSGFDLEQMSELHGTLKSDIHFLEYFSTKLIENEEYGEAISLLESSKHLCMYPSFYVNIGIAFEKTGAITKAEAIGRAHV